MPSWGYINEQENIQNKKLTTAVTKIGNQGEKNTMKILDTIFATDPNIHIFHDINIPKNPKQNEAANVDHIILTKEKCLLVDSKVWKNGKYATKKNGETYRDKKPFPYADTHTLDMAASRYTNYLNYLNIPIEQQPQWTALFVIWPPQKGKTSLWRITHDSQTPTIYCKGTEFKHLIKSYLKNTTKPTPEVTNAFIRLLRKPVAYK
jgi:hypothetical protein